MCLESADCLRRKDAPLWSHPSREWRLSPGSPVVTTHTQEHEPMSNEQLMCNHACINRRSHEQQINQMERMSGRLLPTVGYLMITLLCVALLVFLMPHQRMPAAS